MEITARRTLSAEQIAAYRRDGFLVLRDFFPKSLVADLNAEAAALITQHAGLIDRKNLRCRFQPHHETGKSLFETFDPVIDLADVCRAVALDDRLLNMLHDLYGEPACLFKDKLIFKPPGAKGYVLHQDFIAWPGFPRSFLTVLVPIDASNVENGCTECFAGYHQTGALTREDGEFHEVPAGAVDASRGVPMELEPGDIAVFGGFTPHRSAPNQSRQSRRQLYLSYNALSDGGDQREAHYQDFHNYLRRKYGDFADSYFK